ncbi:F-BAR and double SH3 domains protein 1-like isoform X4 [Acanthopagrus latus]|uniref:F-BAR and double SH3 domains protein 1-like isoform X4 n=1 Tax=Acanthopagrus latus TaxID=8177 RepID=UPI00187BE1F3|nr:F-BAR and double SH3 domains protein 1-like isoform X4 [Acanthopagrus latus]
MQPLPRKVKESQQVKLVFSEQLNKLQTKQHQNTELLEEIRSFSKQRAAIEKEYGQALQRLAVQYQKRDWQRGHTDADTSGSVFGVWRSVVDAVAQSAASRLAAAEEYRRLIGQASRSLHNAKDIRIKKGLEQLQRVQGEVVDSLRELHRIKKRYHQLSHIASVAREKAADAQTRARKSEHGMFHFKTGLHKMATKLSARQTECDNRLTEVRNEYLLTLAAVNTHHQHYYTSDLPHIMEQMDGDVYEDLRSHFTLLYETEMDTCMATTKQYNRIWENIVKVTRERNVLQFLQESVSFSKKPEFTFQSAPSDKVSALQEFCASEAEGCLVKEAKKWASKAAKDYKIITHGERALQTLESRLKLLSGETGLSVAQKMADVQDSVRKAKLSRVKAEARLDLLSGIVTGTELWLHNAMNQAEEELERERRLSEQRKSTEEFSQDEFELTDFEDYNDENGDIFSDPVSASGVCVYPAACRVIYSYQTSQSDELSINEGEEVQVIEEGDMEDWLKVCNSCGQVGYVPERCVQFLCVPAEDSTQLGSFSSTSPTGSTERAPSRGVARALYSYQAQSAEELSFQEGALIQLKRCRHGEVDDGFWEGELKGRIGAFPSLVVEVVYDEGEEEEEEEEPLPTPTMPSFSPPVPVPADPNCSSAPGAASPSYVEDQQQVFCPGVADNTVEDGGYGHNFPDPPSSQLRPVCASVRVIELSGTSSPSNTEAFTSTLRKRLELWSRFTRTFDMLGPKQHFDDFFIWLYSNQVNHVLLLKCETNFYLSRNTVVSYTDKCTNIHCNSIVTYTFKDSFN